MSVEIGDDRPVVRGECVQLLPPSEADEYAIGDVGELFASHAWSVAVIKTEPDRRGPAYWVKKLCPWTNPDNVIDVLVLDPDFQEGDTVRLACMPLDGHWYCHPVNPLYPEEVLTA